jgi:hypothetical protein
MHLCVYISLVLGLCVCVCERESISVDVCMCICVVHDPWPQDDFSLRLLLHILEE